MELVFGSAVNFASRIEDANKQFDTSILISEELLREVARAGQRASPGASEAQGQEQQMHPL